MSSRKKTFSILAISTLFLTTEFKAQNQFAFENVTHSVKLLKPQSDSNFTYNFEYLSLMQIENFGNSLLAIKSGGTAPGDKNGFNLFYDNEEREVYEPYKLKNLLTIREDSVDMEMMDEQGNFFMVRAAGAVDSTWFFQEIQAVEFKEDWKFDVDKFTCEINSKLFSPLVIKRGKEDWGARSFFYAKAAANPQNFKTIADFVITDVYLKQDPMTENQYTIRDANTELDKYKMVLFMNSIIEKVKTGTIPCYVPTIPFKKQFTKAEIKPFFQDEYVAGQNDRYPIGYKMFTYRFKLVEKWLFDPIALAFKKEALGIILMKRNEVKDLNLNADGNIAYTFTTLAYIPFNVSK